MKVVFLQDNGINESLVLCELSAFLMAAGHQTALLIQREERDLRAAVERESPDLLLLPTNIRGHQWVLNTCAKLLRWFPSVPRLLAGTHPTFFPDILDYPGVDLIIVGEAEHATLELLDALAGRRPLDGIQNLWFRRGKTTHRGGLRPLIEDLDSLPLPDRELYFRRYPFMGAFPWKKFTSGRGCFHECSYCYQPLYREMCRGKGTYVRRKSPARVAREVAEVAARYPMSVAHFSDDLFITSKAWVREFAAENPRGLGVPYSMNTSAEYVTDEIAALLARTGCRAVAIGVETSRADLRREILGKDLSDQVIREAARQIRAHGMELVTFNMLASPGESLGDGLRTLRLNVELGATLARVGMCFPIPKTRMAEEATRRGLCVEGFGQDIYRKYSAMDRLQVFFKTAEPEEGAVINLLQLFSLGVSFPPLIPLIERLVRLPRNPLFGLAGFHGLMGERRLFGFSLLDGIRYFAHVGWPGHRTTNFISLV